MKKLAVICYLLINSYESKAQFESNAFTVNVLPPAPEVAVYNKYVQFPVSHYTGTPKIEIPLYTLTERGGLQWPIGLSYHAGGFKVAEDAARTGLGWGLTGMGLISRTVRGLADEFSINGYLTYMKDKEPGDIFFNSGDNADRRRRKLKIYLDNLNSCVDMEPDIFYLVLPGFSAKFYFARDGSIAVDCDRMLKIEARGLQPGTSTYIKSFKVTTPDGIKYYFDELGMTETPRPPGIPCPGISSTSNNVVTSWHLTRMESFNGKSWLQFSYVDYTQYQELLGTEISTHTFITGIQRSHEPGVVKLLYHGKQLKHIFTSSNALKVDFENGKLRTDIDVSPEGKPSDDCFTLGSVLVSDVDHKLLRKFLFEYDYSIGRLTLNSVTESRGNERLPPYKFSYFHIKLPGVKSFQQDMWGFFNDNGNNTLIPSVSYKPETGNVSINEADQSIEIGWENANLENGEPTSGNINLEGADRTPNSSGALAGLLETIVWPTGRKTMFDFETHQYGFEQSLMLRGRPKLPNGKVGISAPKERRLGKTVTTEVNFTKPASTNTTVIDTTVQVTIIEVIQSGLTFSIFRPRILLLKNNRVIRQWSSVAGVGETGRAELISLLPGKYKMIAKVFYPATDMDGDGIIVSNSMQVSLSWKRLGPEENVTKTGGGARIKKIIESDNLHPDKDVVREFDYTMMFKGKKVSSGTAAFFRYTFAHIFQRQLDFSGGESLAQKFELQRFSINRTSLDPTQGSHVGYRQVTEILGKNSTGGKTVYTFTSAIDHPDHVGSGRVPFPPAESRESQRGQLLNREDYSYNGELMGRPIMQLEKKQVNLYKYITENAIVGYKIGTSFNLRAAGNPSDQVLASVRVAQYPIVRGYSRLIETSDTFYFAMGKPHSAQISYVYDEKEKLLTKTSTLQSTGNQVVRQVKFPIEYSLSSDRAIKALVEGFSLEVPIEEAQYEVRGRNKYRLLQAKKYHYKLTQDGNVVCDGKYTTEPVSDITSADPFGMANTLYEERAVFPAYDQFGNLLEQYLSKNIPVAYIWGYEKRLPVAQVVNAKQDEIYVEGFEYSNISGAVNSPTARSGRKYLAEKRFAVPFSPPANGKRYLMSYWYLDNTKWKLKKDVSFNRLITEEKGLDDICIYPDGARVTTLTYDTDGEVTSITGSNWLTRYYEHDGLGRLVTVKDHEGNIVTHVDYTLQEKVSGQQVLNSIRVVESKIKGIKTARDIWNRPKSEVKITNTYFDGFGRKVQEITKTGSPLGKDFVKIFAYDSVDKEPVIYEPFVRNTNHGNYVDVDPLKPGNELLEFYKSPPEGVARNSQPYAEKVFENSALNRVLKQGAPGSDWSLRGHYVQYGYSSNTDTDKVRIFRVINNKLSWDEFYQKGTLQLVTDNNEHGTKIRKFSDRQGHIILERQQVGTNLWEDTYFVYELHDHLLFVVPPNSSKKLNTLDRKTNIDLSEELFSYYYDNKGRVVEKKMPGVAPVYLVYDSRDRQVLSQNGNQRARNEWSFQKYDEFNRVILEGITMITGSRADVQLSVDRFYNTNKQMFETTGILMQGYTNISYPILNKPEEVTKANYYDDYGFLQRLNESKFSFMPELGNTNKSFERVTGLITGSRVKVLGTENYLQDAYYYDDQQRLVQTVASNHLNGIDVTTNKYRDFMLMPISTHRTHSNTISVTERFEYDNDFRMVNLFHTINEQPEILLSSLRYNELGKRKEISLHRTKNAAQFLQVINLRYNERGWLKNISSDMFSEQLYFNETDPSLGNKALFTDDISAVKWSKGWGAGKKELAYLFSYDHLRRLKKADYKDLFNPTNNGRYNVGGANGIQYLPGGNIDTLDIQGSSGQQPILVDKLTYNYTGNQVTQVEDEGSSAAGFINGSSSLGEFSYDNNGNLVRDANKKLSQIRYNFLDLPEQMVLGSGTKINFIYSASGKKLSQLETGAFGEQIVDYVGPFIYVNHKLTQIIHIEGRVVIQPENGQFDYQYYLKDHLGSTRVVISENTGETDIGATPISKQKDRRGPQNNVSDESKKPFSYLSRHTVEEFHYYPFGDIIPDLSSSKTQLPVNFLYNGKERIEFGINYYDYGARRYDPQLARWDSPDPFYERSFSSSPYCYVKNNPANTIDPDGREGYWYGQYFRYQQLVAAIGQMPEAIKENCYVQAVAKNTEASVGVGLSFNLHVNLGVAKIDADATVVDANLTGNAAGELSGSLKGPGIGLGASAGPLSADVHASTGSVEYNSETGMVAHTFEAGVSTDIEMGKADKKMKTEIARSSLNENARGSLSLNIKVGVGGKVGVNPKGMIEAFNKCFDTEFLLADPLNLGKKLNQ